MRLNISVSLPIKYAKSVQTAAGDNVSNYVAELILKDLKRRKLIDTKIPKRRTVFDIQNDKIKNEYAKKARGKK